MRNEKLNQFKAIAAFWVVFIHCKFPANLGNAVSIIARWAVPFFFIISGYYVCPEYMLERKSIKRKISNVAKLAILMELTYISFDIHDSGLIVLSRIYFAPQSLLRLLLYGRYGKCGVGWFVYSLLECYIILFFGGGQKINEEDFVYPITVA